MATRLYVVRAIVGGQEREYLVDAGTQAAARLHVAKKHVEAAIANGREVARLMDKGVKPESATQEEGNGSTEPIPFPTPKSDDTVQGAQS